MQRYIVRRLLQFIPVLFLVSVGIFLIMRVVPGDVALMILVGPDGTGTVDPKQLEALRTQLGLNDPLYMQYFHWVGGVLTGDWGQSLRSQTPVWEEITNRFPLTFEMCTLTVIISVSIALPLGILMAMRQNSPIDYVARFVSIGGLAMPTFWVGALMLLTMVVFFNWIPPLGYTELWENPWNNIQQIIWACLALGYALSAVVARMTRSTLLEVLRQDYIRTAWAKGLRERTIMVRHALKNAILPVITIVGLQYASLMGGTVIMERIWNLPGLGTAVIDSINFRDYPMVQGLVLLFALIILFVNLVIDLMYAWLDPRIRYN